MTFGTIGLSGEMLLRERNDFDPLNDRFEPARQRFTFGPNATINLSDSMALSLQAQGVYLSEDVFPVTGIKRSFWGAQATATLDVALP